MRGLSQLRALSIVALTATAAVLAVQNAADDRVLDAWTAKWVEPGDPPSVAVPKLLAGFRTLSWGTPDEQQYGLFPELSLTAREVLERGGPCESKSRLLRTLLHLRGISSDRVLLRDENLKVVHTVTEVELEDGSRMIVDPLYGLYFPRAGGGFYALEDLRRDPAIACRRIEEVLAQEPPPAPPYDRRLADYCPDLAATYAHPLTTIAWKPNSALRRVALDIVSRVMGSDWLENTPRPYFMERPRLMLLALVLGADLVLIATLVPGFALRALAPG
jgi:hypothetical protein